MALDPRELDAISERAENFRAEMLVQCHNGHTFRQLRRTDVMSVVCPKCRGSWATFGPSPATDIDALVAECRRLQAENAEMAAAFDEIADIARSLKIRAEAVTVDEPVWIIPNLVAHDTHAIQALCSKPSIASVERRMSESVEVVGLKAALAALCGSFNESGLRRQWPERTCRCAECITFKERLAAARLLLDPQPGVG